MRAMMILTILAVPPSPNELRRKYRNPHAYKRLREQWEHDLHYGVSCSRHRQELREHAQQGRLQVEITVYHARAYDPDNLQGCQKVVLDALVNIGFLADDSIQKLHLLPARQIRSKELKTTVKIGPAA